MISVCYYDRAFLCWYRAEDVVATMRILGTWIVIGRDRQQRTTGRDRYESTRDKTTYNDLSYA